MLNWMVRYRTVFYLETVLTRIFKIETELTLNWFGLIRTVWLNWIVSNRNVLEN